ncbi:MAG: hypothetical protein QOH06_1624 [Acidobacteriota bacterium]|jgi:hypothetical protein|nr:hypothetical protein [Acidobacteriota bacterium]
MNRKDFGDWGGQVDDQTFWRAVAMLGVIGGLWHPAPRDAREAEEIVGELSFPTLPAQPLDESPGALWRIGEEYLESALRGQLVEAAWLSARWEELRQGSWYVRLQSPELFSNQQEIAAALKEQARAVLYFPLQSLTSAEDWQWPLHIALPRSDRLKFLWAGLKDWQNHSTSGRQLVRFSREEGEPVVELLVLPGTPAEALEVLETFPVPIRAHCLLLLAEGGVELDGRQIHALFRLQQLALAGGVVIASSGDADADATQRIINLVYGLTHNLAIDQVFADSSMPLPLMFFDPAMFRLARVGNFAEKISVALEGAGETSVDLGREAARGVLLEEGSYPAMEVAYRLRDVLRKPGAFDQESRGSTWSMEILKAARKNDALGKSLQSYAVGELQPERRLQMDVLEEGRPAGYFHPDRFYTVDTWIGQREGALSGDRFPEELLPGEKGGHLLTMTLFAPGHMAQPIVETIYLPKAGESTRCRFSFETSADIQRFEARITIAYLNRVLQTYLLTGAPDEEIALTPEMATAADWQGLDDQTSYGATIVLNRMQGKRHAMMQAGYKALAFSLDGLDEAMTQIESRLDSSKWERPEFQDVRAEGSRKLILYLAKHGFTFLQAMKEYALKDDAGQAFLKNLLEADPVQVLAANRGARLPVELFYANPYPKDKAVLCPTYEAEMGRESCGGCPHVDQDHFCPLGFWSLRKVIEWHDFEAAKLRQQEFAPREFAVESADRGLRRDRLGKIDQVLVGVSDNVDQVEPKSTEKLLERILKAGIEPVPVKDWDDWIEKVAPEGNRLLVLLPHTFKNEYDEECMEICGEERAGALIDAACVSAGRKPGPIVLLIGCNTDNLGIPFRSFVSQFMSGGSAIVLSTVMHVLGRHAAPLAAELVEAIAEAQKVESTTFGSLMRDVRRKWIRSGPPICLGLKCFGDARWRF